jgi:hypothetical protein
MRYMLDNAATKTLSSLVVHELTTFIATKRLRFRIRY